MGWPPLLGALFARRAGGRGTPSPPAVELAGYLDAAVGVGEAARRYVEAMRRVELPVLERDVPLPGRDPARAETPPGAHRPAPGDVAFNLLCLNPEQMLPYLDSPEAPRLAGRTTIGIWSWEVDVVPPGWAAAAEAVAEVWTYSRFSARLIGDAIGAPVRAIPPPISEVARPAPAEPPRLPRGFRVLLMFDYLSTLERKNPLGALEAYRQAFAPDDGAVLVVKSLNGQHRPERRAQLTEAAHGRPDVVFIDQAMSGAERDALLGACDCCLSLHRSEGHGLPLAEAMAGGKPVIATGYGGNTEFMSERNSYLVRWRPTSVGEGVEHYPAAATWAEPDVAHAAVQLRAARNDAAEAQRRALRGQADVRELLSPAAVGEQIAQRLTDLGAARRHRRWFGGPAGPARQSTGGA